MRFNQITSVLFLSLGALSLCQDVGENEHGQDLDNSHIGGARGVSNVLHREKRVAPDSLLMSKRATSGPPKRLECKITKKGGSQVGPKKKGGKRSELLPRTGGVQEFFMDQPPQFARLSQLGDQLYTFGLAGCSVVVIASPTYAFAVHVSRGITGVAKAQTAVANLMALYNQHKGLAGTVKAMVLTADQDGMGDEIAVALEAGLKEISSRTSATYDAFKLHALKNDKAAYLTIPYVESAYPFVNVAGTCYYFN